VSYILEWIVENQVFSGIAGVVLTLIAGLLSSYFIKKKKENSTPTQSISSGNNSTNIQGGNDVNVTIGEKNVRR
jgi:hypothetical protein